jgi:hypothetical protein
LINLQKNVTFSSLAPLEIAVSYFLTLFSIISRCLFLIQYRALSSQSLFLTDIAVTGLPDPMENHASVLAQFTVECSEKAAEMQKKNPNWSNSMQMRFGIHSGPIVAGILRGQKSRFELFGDTINTASRMESTGKPDRIQVSPDTAELLREEGMESWLVPREELVEAKGKGALATFWLTPSEDDGSYYPSDDGSSSEGEDN